MITMTQLSNYQHLWTDTVGNKAWVVLNPRDSMVFCQVQQLSADDSEALSFLTQLKQTIQAEQYGGKTVLSFADAIADRQASLAPNANLMPGKFNARFSSRQAMDQAMQVIGSKAKVQAWLQRLEQGELESLAPEQVEPRQLAEFKIRYSSFASKEKIICGQYTIQAEQDKLSNPFVHHIVLRQQQQIIACLMLTSHGDGNYVYASDYIVHPDYRSQGLAQALALHAYQLLAAKMPQAKGLWYVAGGYGALGVGSHLYSQVLPSQMLNPTACEQDLLDQAKLGFYIHFAAPKPLLLAAANRQTQAMAAAELDGKVVNLAKDGADDIAQALQWLTASNEPDLAAKLPAATLVTQVASPARFFATQDDLTQAKSGATIQPTAPTP